MLFLFAVVNSAVMNMHVCVFALQFGGVGLYLEVELLGQMLILCLTF